MQLYDTAVQTDSDAANSGGVQGLSSSLLLVSLNSQRAQPGRH